VRVLTVNAGSTSTKVAYVEGGRAEAVTVDDALALPPPDAVVHRVVHGGNRDHAALVDDDVFDQLSRLTELAPLHQPPALRLLTRCRRAWPTVPNVACFDTAFHATVPEAARTYALPASLRHRVRAYGFHGISYAWAARRIADLVPGARRAVVAHLGGGQSLCAIIDGRSVTTTMGFTPVDGLVMATRPGAVDPGAVLWLARRGHEDLEHVMEHESGLKGLCGHADMRDVHAGVARGDPDAQLAFDVWRHRAVMLAGACVAAIGGIDVLAFTGGIGEHDPVVRGAIADGLAHLGVAIDEPTDAVGDRVVSPHDARVRVLVVDAREDLQMADEAAALLA
jgi:acetate kinase